MRRNELKHRLREGEPCLGTWLTLPEPFVARYLARAGFHWLAVDLEHQPLGIETAAHMFAAAAEAGVCPLARVAWNEPVRIKRALDSGAWGIIVPMVDTPAQAAAAVAAVRYPPRGDRSLGGGYAAFGFQATPEEYVARADEELLLVLQTESPRGVENAAAIAAVEGVDALFVGPYDLHARLDGSTRGDSDLPAYRDALRQVLAAARGAGAAAGIHTPGAAVARRRLAEGFRLLAIGSDAGFLAAGARAELAALADDS